MDTDTPLAITLRYMKWCFEHDPSQLLAILSRIPGEPLDHAGYILAIANMGARS